MCPACIASTAAIVAGAGSTGGILAVCIGKVRNFFRVSRPGPFQKALLQETTIQKAKEK